MNTSRELCNSSLLVLVKNVFMSSSSMTSRRVRAGENFLPAAGEAVMLLLLLLLLWLLL